MNESCVIVIPKEYKPIPVCMMNFKREWVHILIDNDEEKAPSNQYYRLPGTLIDITGNRGGVLLKRGILLPVPLNCIKIGQP